MLAVPPERLVEALGLLDPTHRALLELSLHREVADPALAELLRTDADTVVQQRTDALQRLGDVLDAPPGEVEDALIHLWRGEPEAEAEAAEEPEPAEEEAEAAEEEAEAEEEAQPSDEEAEPEQPADEPEPARAGDAWTPADAVTAGEAEPPRHRGLWAAVTALAAIGLVLVLVLGGGGDDDEPESRDGGGTPTAPAGGNGQPADSGGEPVEIQSVLGTGDAAGTARIVDSGGRPQLELKLTGLAEGGYAVWLYNSIGDARQLATARGPDPSVKAPLPEGYERFRYIDVSQEPDDGNPNHSGASVLRVPTADLSRG